MKKTFSRVGLILVLVFINFFIFIGEITKFIFVTAFRLFLKSVNYIIYFIFNVLKDLKLLFKNAGKINFIKYFKPLIYPFIFLKKILLFLISPKIAYFLLGSIISLIIIFSYESYIFINNLPSPKNIGKVNFALTTHITDRHGKLLYEVYRDQNRTPVKLDMLPKHVINAIIAIEDKDFYKHKGVSVLSGVMRALKETIISRKLQGGSTITQQLVKSSLLTPERTIQRKIKEIILAIWAEKMYSKKEILEMYLNQVAYGGASYGIEEAAKTYFGKSAKDLSLPEAALLSGLPQAPSIYSPYINPNLALNRRHEVLKAMLEQNYINKNEIKGAMNTPLNINPPKTKINAPHFVFYVKSELEDKYDIKQVEEGGLKVTTTIDLGLQDKVESILRDELKNLKNLNVGNGGILITRPATGEILAMVGSSDYFATPYGAFNTTTALRQPGSSIKPLMYSLALTKGYTAATMIDDSPVTYSMTGSEPYRPVNYDGRYHGKVPLRYALANSFNIPAVKVLDTLGVNNFILHAQNLGITTFDDPSRYGLSITLGGGEVRMVDMATAFGVFANGGNKVDLNSFAKIEDMNGNILNEQKVQKKKVLDEGASFIISDILADNTARSLVFGPTSLLQIPGYHVAVKTGTTNDKRDNWTIGYTPDFLVVVWVGNNDNTPMNPYLSSGITGAAPIWNKVMTYLLKNYQGGDIWFKKPENIIEKKCVYGRLEYFVKGTENSVTCQTPTVTTTHTSTTAPTIVPTNLPSIPNFHYYSQ